MLDHLRVLAYGEAAPLKSLASVAVREGQALVVTPFDPEACGPATFRLEAAQVMPKFWWSMQAPLAGARSSRVCWTAC